MAHSPEQFHHVTLLVADWSEYVQVQQDQKALDDLLSQLDASLADLPSSEGSLVTRTPQSFLAAWGLEEEGEQDAEYAVQFALALRDATQDYQLDSMLPLKLALASGDVCFSPPTGNTTEAVLTGQPLELCQLMLVVIQDGGVAVSQSTHRLVEGLFTFTPLAQLPVRGQTEPVEIYRAVAPKAIHFRILQRGIEGVTTRMVGRDIEMMRMRDVYETVTDETENYLVTVIGEAGTGKTRLLTELERLRDLNPDSTRLFRAQATPEILQQPYGLLRLLFMQRFDIQESDPEAVILKKMQAGVEGFMGSGNVEHAQILAQLVGFPVRGASGLVDSASAAQAEQQALNSLSAFFRAVDSTTTRGVIALHLEDMQWADDKSLDAILWLFEHNVRNRLVVVVLTSPELLERRPRWGLEQKNSIRIDLHALRTREARKLVDEALQKMPEIPNTLRDWIVERSGGNPLYIEELVRSLIEHGVILTGRGHQPWQANLKRLDSVRIPDTLTGLLQTQLANLPVIQRIGLQRAAVIGRSFWDAALQALGPGDDFDLHPLQALAGLSKRNLIYRKERSAFANMQEYAFFSNLLRQVAYDSVPEATCKRYHRLAAEWLVDLSIEAPSTLAARIAEHYERAGDGSQAVAYLTQAAREARRLNDLTQSRQFLQRAIQFAQEPSDTPGVEGKASLLYELGELMILIGESAQASVFLEECLELARGSGNTWAAAEALGRLGWAAYYQGEYDQALCWLEEGMQAAQQAENRPALLLILRQLGNVASAKRDFAQARDHYEESLALARQLDDRANIAPALNNLGLIAALTGDYIQARHYLEESFQVAQQRSDRMYTGLVMGNLGINACMMGEYILARQHLQESIQISRSVGSELLVPEALVWTALCDAATGDPAQAKQNLRQALHFSQESGNFPLVLGALAGFASLLATQENLSQAVEILALLSGQTATDDLIQNLVVVPLLERLHRELPPQTFGQAWARGQALDLEAAISALEQDS